MRKKMKTTADEKDLKVMVEDLQEQLKKKRGHLTEARLRLQRTKNDVHRLKGIITYQRDLLMKLYH